LSKKERKNKGTVTKRKSICITIGEYPQGEIPFSIDVKGESEKK
jgi:hypothetical protein